MRATLKAAINSDCFEEAKLKLNSNTRHIMHRILVNDESKLNKGNPLSCYFDI
jgi:hypothetical protein